jgi:hypothetical protein
MNTISKHLEDKLVMLHSTFLKIKKRKKRNAKFKIASKLKSEPIIS